MRHFREVGDDGMTVNILAERDRNARLAVAPFVRLEQIAHDDFRLNQIGNFNADGRFSRHGRENVNAFRLERGGEVVGQALNFFQLHAGRGMQFVTRNRRAFGDVAERNLDVELRECLLHHPRVRHQLFLRLRRLHRHVGMLEKIHRRQLIIANHRHARDRHRLRFFWRESRAWHGRRHRRDRRRTVGDGDDRFNFRFSRFFFRRRFHFFGGNRFRFNFLNDFFGVRFAA